MFDLGIEGGDHEVDGELLAETEEIIYACEMKEKYSMMFDEPIPLHANHWYVRKRQSTGKHCVSYLRAVRHLRQENLKLKSENLNKIFWIKF